MPRRAVTILVPLVAAVLLAGCAAGAPPAAPSSSAEPTPAATSTPTAPPEASATPEAPAAPPSGSAAADEGTPLAEAPRCADGVVIDPEEPAAGVAWAGDYDEQIAASEPRPGFEPASLLDSEGVLCAVVFRMPLHGPGSDGRVGLAATALVRDAELREGVQAWALEQGYTPLDEGDEQEYVLEDGDAYSARMSIVVIGEARYGDIPLEGLERRSGLELEPTDLLLTHVDFQPEA